MRATSYPCLCLCRGFVQMTMVVPCRLITRHRSHIGFTDALTFIGAKPPSFLDSTAPLATRSKTYRATAQRRLRREGADGAPHGKQGRLQDIQGVDFRGAGAADRPGQRFALDNRRQALARRRRQALGIGDTGNGLPGREHHDGGDDRPGQRPATSLVNPADAGHPLQR